jgi:hypothetical protein
MTSSSTGELSFILKEFGPPLKFSGVRKRPAMLKFRFRIVAINPAPADRAAYYIGFMGRLRLVPLSLAHS